MDLGRSLFKLLLLLALSAFIRTQDLADESKVQRNVTTGKPTFVNRNVTTTFPSVAVTPSPDSGQQPDIVAVINKLQSRSRQLIERALKEALPVILQSRAGSSLSGPCMASGLKFVFALRNMEHWTMQMLDASGKIPLGLLRGTRASFGDYDECLELKVGKGREGLEPDGHNFRGQYCALDIRPPSVAQEDSEKLEEIVRTFAGSSNVVQDVGLSNPVKFFNSIHIRIGVCLPSSCSLKDVRTIAQDVSESVMMNVEVKRCEVQESQMHLEKYHFFAGSYVFPVAALTVLATLLDGLPRLLRSFATRGADHEGQVDKPKRKGKLTSLLCCFSAVSNGKKILTTQTSDTSFGAIHGLRFLSMTWIIFGHTYSFGHYLQISGIYKAKDIKKDFLFQPILNASFSVDTFFVLSGILISFSALKRLDGNKGRLQILKYYFHRYIRTAPAFMMVTCLMLLGPLVGSGPVWRDTLDPFVNNCRARWWANFFFLSYIWKEKDICLPYGWYLSVDMLYYVVSPFFAIMLFRRPRLGLFVCGIGAVASMVSVAAITVLFQQPPIPLFTSSTYTIDDYINIIFFKPYTHFAPYCIGLATGYLLFKRKHLVISPRTRALGWLTTLSTSLTVIYVIYVWNSGREPQLLETVLYASTSRSLWAACIAWLVVLCIHGYGGAVNTLLSWRGFVPLSRLTFMAYLMHPMLMYCFMANLRTTVPFGHYFFVWLFFAHLCTSYGVAFIVSLLYEAPFIRLERLCSGTDRFGSGPAPVLTEKLTREPPPSSEDISLSDNEVPTKNNGELTKTGYDNKGFVCHL